MAEKNLAVMIMVNDTARADVSLTPSRTYYRFATDSSIEDGQIAPVADFADITAKVCEAITARSGERPLPRGVRIQLFDDNRLSRIEVSEESLRRAVAILDGLAPEFTFLRGFLA